MLTFNDTLIQYLEEQDDASLSDKMLKIFNHSDKRGLNTELLYTYFSVFFV